MLPSGHTSAGMQPFCKSCIPAVCVTAAACSFSMLLQGLKLTLFCCLAFRSRQQSSLSNSHMVCYGLCHLETLWAFQNQLQRLFTMLTEHLTIWLPQFCLKPYCGTPLLINQTEFFVPIFKGCLLWEIGLT